MSQPITIIQSHTLSWCSHSYATAGISYLMYEITSICVRLRDLYKSASIPLQRGMSFTLSRFANVLTASEFPYVFCSYQLERTKNAYSKELTLRTALSSHKLSSY